tara:strand:+ start:59 stop:337 length:279 start_codon:yes stop_codon:yes gene_type:complete
MLPPTQARTVAERLDEILNLEGVIIEGYTAYTDATFTPVRPNGGSPDNLRFFSDGLEVLAKMGSGKGGKEISHLRLYDEGLRRMLKYTLCSE